MARPACPGCGWENEAGSRFCNQCGTPLESHRPTTTDAPRRPARSITPAAAPRWEPGAPAAYTPRHLAEKILTSRGALEGERKQVTVLFADITGSLEIAEQIDPEDWHRLMDRFFAILTEGVHRFEGTINQYTGDGVMALFGAPIAHEDHAQRACHAALYLTHALRLYANELRLARGLSFSVRIGLNSGEVVVGKIGDDLRMDYTAQGHTVGLAARMEQLAEPGRVFLTQYTAALVSGYFDLEDLGAFAIKGARQPLRVYALRGVGPLRTRFEVARTRGFSRFVGREPEAGLLESALTRALTGDGHTVAIVGEPGVGKTRLCHEFLQRCRARGIAVYQAQCFAHGRTIPFMAALDLLRGYFGITDQDDDEAARRKIAGTLVLLGDELTDALPLLFDFLGVPDPERRFTRLDPAAHVRRVLDVCKHIVRARSRREPAVLLVEDLHWIDSDSEPFIEALAEATPGTRSLLLVNFRPEYSASWAQGAGTVDNTGAPPHLSLRLPPLEADAVGVLMDELLGPNVTLRKLKDLIHEHTAGNPFFVEEVVQSLFDQGVLGRADPPRRGLPSPVVLHRPIDDITIPPTIQAVLAARIDRLPESAKQVLQTAAVIGREFAESVLGHVVSQDVGSEAGPPHVTSLDALVAADFLYQSATHPEAVFAFRHPLTQEVAYHSPLAGRRTQVHASVARAVTSLYPDRLDERAALIAHHWRHGGDVVEAARWRRRAAEWARASNPTEALQHWRLLRELLPEMAESPDRDRLAIDSARYVMELGRHLGLSGADAVVIFKEGEALAQRLGDRKAMAMLVNAYGAVRSHSGSAEEFLESSLRATLLADQTDDHGLQLATRTRLVVAHVTVGNIAQALALTDYCLAATDDINLGAAVLGYSPRIRLMKERGALLIDLGHLDKASAQLDAAAQLARTHRDVEVAGGIHGEYVTLARIRGDAPTALRHAHEVMRVAEKFGSPFFRAGAFLSFGHAHILSARWEEAGEALEQALAIARAGHARVETEAFALAWLAQAHLGRGNLTVALETVEQGLAVAQRRRTRLAECIASIGRARVLLRRGQADDPLHIAADLSHALALAEATGAKSNVPFIHVELARLAALTGDEPTRVDELRTAQRLFSAMGATARCERVGALLASSAP